MWELVAREMGLPWRVVEGIHWEIGREEMASRANAYVLHSPSATDASGRSSPCRRRIVAHSAAAPILPVDRASEQPCLSHHVHASRTRSMTSEHGEHATIHTDSPSSMTIVSEGEQRQMFTQEPSGRNVHDDRNTSVSSV